MSRQVRRFGVFIASPSDVSLERDDIVDVIEEWNKQHSVKQSIEMEALRWEGNLLPNIEERAQELANRTLLARADLLIAVFWTRIGTPTGGHLSGTIEELTKFKGEKFAYFCQRDIPRAAIDGGQVNSVNALMTQLKERGASYGEYKEREELKSLLRQHLNEWMNNTVKQREPETGVATVDPGPKLFCKPECFQTLVNSWATNGKQGCILLFNAELSTFKTEADFRDTWGRLTYAENIQKIILVLPPHKKDRLLRYVRQYTEEFLRCSLAPRFEIAEFRDYDGSFLPVAFATFRYGENPDRGAFHETGLIFLLAEPFSTRDQDAEGFTWRYEIALSCSKSDPVFPGIKELLTRYMPNRRRALSTLLNPESETAITPNPTRDLPGNRQQAAALHLRLAIREDLFISNVPTYVLDENFFIVDWNAAFELIFGRCGFHRGEYVVEFLSRLENAEQVIKRGKEFLGDLPLFDDEEFVFVSPEFGRMHFIKTTAQALSRSQGLYQGWNVALTLTCVEHISTYRTRLRSVVEYETLMGIYAPAYNRIMRVFSEYQLLIRTVMRSLSGVRTVLDLGMGPGHFTNVVAAEGMHVTGVEANEAMLACAVENCAEQMQNRRIEIHKANIEAITARELTSVHTGNFVPPYDAVVMLNVFYAICDKPRVLDFVRSVIRPGGILVITGPNDQPNLNTLYARVSAEVGGRLPDDLRIFRQVNNEMRKKGLLTSSVATITNLLTQAQFEVVETTQSVFADQGMMIVAKCR